MDSKLAGSEEMAKPESLLEPLPTLNMVKCVEKLDAGLRSLDHCEQLLCYPVQTHLTNDRYRQNQATSMALCAPTAAHPSGPLGNTTFSDNAESHAVSGPRYLFFNYGQPRHTYLFHDILADSVLVWIYKSGQRVWFPQDPFIKVSS